MKELPPWRGDNEHADAMEHFRRELRELRVRWQEDNDCCGAASLPESEKLEAAWLEQLKPLSEAVSRLTGACNDSKARIATILSEVQALQQFNVPLTGGMPQQSAPDLDLLKQDIRRLTDLWDSSTGMPERVKSGLEGLQEEVKELSRMYAALHDTIEQHNLPQVLTELDTLQQQVAMLQGSTLSFAQSRGTEPGVQHDLAMHILEELRRLVEQAQHGGRMATDILSSVNELGQEQHRQHIDGSRSKSQMEWREQALLVSEQLKRLETLPANQGDIATKILQEVEALRCQVTAASNRSPDVLALQDTMVAPLTQALDRSMELSLNCQDKVNSIVDQVGFPATSSN